MAERPPASTWPRAEFDTASRVKMSRLIPGDGTKPPEVASTLVIIKPTMLCSPTTAKSAPKAAVRCRARRLASMAARAGSFIAGGTGPPGSKASAATPHRRPRFLQLRAWNQPTREQATLSATDVMPKPIDVPKEVEPPLL
eukprot:Skav226296  [mRNA]  locus=scaffold3301:285887:289356:- [translate_table: standard]